MTRGDLKIRVARILGIALGASGDVVDETQLLEQLANEAVIDVLSRTRVNVHSATAALTALSDEYEFNIGTVLQVHGLSKLPVASDEIVLFEQPRDRLTDQGYAFVGFARIKFGVAAAAGDILKIWYTPTPETMTLDTDDPSAAIFGGIPVRFHGSALVNYMLWKAADKVGDTGSRRGENYRVLYEGQDGLGNAGSALGHIKTAVNMQGQKTLIRSYRKQLVGDRSSRHWIG